MGLRSALIIDDETDVRKSVRLTLTDAGYDIVEVENGEEAIS